MQSLNVRDEGAQGNGTADDTAEFQSAVNKLQTAGGGELLVPPGVYSLSGAITATNVPIVVRGCGRELSVLRWKDGSGGINYQVNSGVGRTLRLTGLSLETTQKNGGAAIHGEWPGGTSMETYCQLDDVRIVGANNTS